jgi:uncharacterized membrane protein YcaP (DUF421 family)
MEDIFFDGWNAIIRTAVVGAAAYGLLVLFLRVSGKRTLSKMNAFDWVVTVALGSTLAAILVNQDVSLAQGALALALLIGMQLLVTWSSVRARWVRAVVTGEPSLLLHRGAFLPDALHKERVNEDDVRAAVRAAGFESLEDVDAVILETDGSISVISRASRNPEGSALDGVDLSWSGPPKERRPRQ